MGEGDASKRVIAGGHSQVGARQGALCAPVGCRQRAAVEGSTQHTAQPCRVGWQVSVVGWQAPASPAIDNFTVTCESLSPLERLRLLEQ